MKVLIVGAGPAGLLLANYLVRRPGYDISLVERRSDPRLLSPEALRTFPIAMQSRGLNALEDIQPGLETVLSSKGIWAKGVCVHGGKKDRKIPRNPPSLSIDRNAITMTLFEELVKNAENHKGKGTTLSIQFDSRVEGLDLEKKCVKIAAQLPTSGKASAAPTSTKTVYFDQLVAADGGRSQIRKVLEEHGELHVVQKDIPDDYRTIFLSPSSLDGSIQLESDLLHGWMFGASSEGNVRIITAPIDNDCVSGAIVFDKGMDPFQSMKTAKDVYDYFEKLCPNNNQIGKLLTPEQAQQLLERPTSTLVSVRCDRLHVRNRVLLLGDAAHAVSASVGHGCNSALQDVQVFCNLLDQNKHDWSQTLPAYTRARLDDAHALSDLSDYSTPRTKLMKIEWLVRTVLRPMLPSWLARFMRPLPMELLSEGTLSYSDVLARTQWWINRVKRSHKAFA